MKTKLIVLVLFWNLTSFKHRLFAWIAIGDSITYLNDHLEEPVIT